MLALVVGFMVVRQRWQAARDNREASSATGVTELLAGRDDSRQSIPPLSLQESPPNNWVSRSKGRCGGEKEDAGQDEETKDVADGTHCNMESHAEYAGDVVRWGSQNIQATAEGCCGSCQADAPRGCNAWVWCGVAGGCRGAEGEFGECWLKHQPNAAEKRAFSRGNNVPWWGLSFCGSCSVESKVLRTPTHRSSNPDSVTSRRTLF